MSLVLYKMLLLLLQQYDTQVPGVISYTWYELVSREQILRRKRVEGNIHFPCSAARRPSGLVGKLHIC